MGLRSCHSILTTSKKLSKLTNQQLFWDPAETGGHGGNCCLPDGWMWRITTYLSRNPQANTSTGTTQDRKTWTVVGNLLEGQCGPLWDLKTPGGPSYQTALAVLTITSESSARSSWWTSEKNLLLLVDGGGEKEPFEIHQNTLFFLTKPAYRRNSFSKAWPTWGGAGNPNQPPLVSHVGEGKYTIAARQPSCPTWGGRPREAQWNPSCRAH